MGEVFPIAWRALLEDVAVDSVSDLGSSIHKLEAALKESGGADAKELEMSEVDKKRIAEEADDGWSMMSR